MLVAIVAVDPRLTAAVVDGLARAGVSHHRFESLAALLVLDDAALASIVALYVPGFVAIDGSVLARLPGLRGVVSPFTGTEGFDRSAASERGVLIGNGQIEENVDSMAEATVLMLLAAAYRLPAAIAAMADGAWPRPAARGRLVKAMTVGIVGYGRIAQGVAARLVPFGCRLLIHAPRLHAPLPTGAEAVSLLDLVITSDVIIMLASLNPGSRHLIDAELLARAKTDVIVVNTARGGLIDEAALVAATQAGRLGMIALDVFETEPLPPESLVRALPSAILTPHTVGHTRETIDRMPLHALGNILALLRGDPPLTLVNPEALPAWRAKETPR